MDIFGGLYCVRLEHWRRGNTCLFRIDKNRYVSFGCEKIDII